MKSIIVIGPMLIPYSDFRLKYSIFSSPTQEQGRINKQFQLIKSFKESKSAFLTETNADLNI